MTPAKHCKALTGLKLIEVANAVDKPRRTLEDWHKSKPALFEAVCLGVLYKQTERR